MHEPILICSLLILAIRGSWQNSRRLASFHLWLEFTSGLVIIQLILAFLCVSFLRPLIHLFVVILFPLSSGYRLRWGSFIDKSCAVRIVWDIVWNSAGFRVCAHWSARTVLVKLIFAECCVTEFGDCDSL